MIRKTKGRDRWYGATPKTSGSGHSTAIHLGIKVLTARFALWGLIPAGGAAWLIQRGGLKDA
jgi:hypothetical protein